MNNHLKEQQNGWQERLQALLGRMEVGLITLHLSRNFFTV